MSNKPVGPNFVNLGEEPTMQEPLNLLPIQAEVPISGGQSLRLTATPGGPSIADKLEALRDPVSPPALGKRPRSPSGDKPVKVAKPSLSGGGGPSVAVPFPSPSPVRSPIRSPSPSSEGVWTAVPIPAPEPKSKRCTSNRRVTRSSSAPQEPSAPTGAPAPVETSLEVPASGSPVSRRPPPSKAPAKPSSSAKPSRSGPRNSVDKGKGPMDGTRPP
uniref:anther-specific proline-rich protein APG-like n=1 Tax=Fragaria vesca subsp. vesca TaxID=101020 RepID=UPI0005C93740|nr:PREDICTED: anther-specific proline-rich protein APG-like [Fragaria vesca subsp. vesca]